MEGINKKRLFVIQGPTASGKTGLSVQLAAHFKTEVISADSRQFYKELSIGTAKPSPSEMHGITHHFIDCCSIENPINISQYATLCNAKIQDVFQRKDHLILSGGSGQFIDAVLNGLDEIPVFPKLQESLQATFDNKGFEFLRTELAKKDPVAFERIDNRNPRRVLRALEVFLGSGKSIVFYHKSPKEGVSFSTLRFSIEWHRQDLYDRINQRVDEMITLGLEQEVSALLLYKTNPVFNTVGYKEWLPYFEGYVTEDDVISKIKQHTRNYAKRQITWLNRYPDLHQLDPYSKQPLCEQLLNFIPEDNG